MTILGASGWRPRRPPPRLTARRRATSLLTLVALAVFLFAGCGDDEPDEKNKSGVASSTSLSATTGSSESPEPDTPAPATGPVIKEDYYSFHLPEDLDWDLDPGDTIAFAEGPDLEPYEIAVQTNRLLTGDVGRSVDEDFRVADESGRDTPLKRGENRAIDGVEGWTSETTSAYAGDPVINYSYGTAVDGYSFEIKFMISKDDPNAHDLIEATLASLEWKR